MVNSQSQIIDDLICNLQLCDEYFNTSPILKLTDPAMFETNNRQNHRLSISARLTCSSSSQTGDEEEDEGCGAV